MHQIIVYAFPVFSLLMAIEFGYGWLRGRNTYRLNDSISSLSQGLLSQLVAVCTQLFQIGLYAFIYPKVALITAASFWDAWYGWVLAIVLFDFCDYWLHRVGHESAVFWAAHVVHHQSQDFNFSTALRQESTVALLGWPFYLPMALVGVPPEQYAMAGLIVLLYQFWIHTEHVGKLGWFDRVFSSPSNHRVHHGVNLPYLDKNYGGMLVIWDRMFGTFTEETEKAMYGTRAPVDSWDPLWAVAANYWALAQDSWHARSWADKVRVWFKSPSWRPADVAERFPRPAFDMATVQRFDPPVGRTAAWFGAVQFVAMVAASAAFLWYADDFTLGTSAMLTAAVAAGLWGLGAVLQGRIGIVAALAIDVVAGMVAWRVLV